MATLLACANGNFTDAATWALCSSAAEDDNENNFQAVSAGASTVYANFTPGVITVDGIALKISAVGSLTPVGTATISLRNTVANVDVASVTVNISDLLMNGTLINVYPEWTFFKFSAPILLLAATTYAVKIVTSGSATQFNITFSGVGGSISRQLRTTTTQAPATGDKLLVSGELTGAGTGNTLIVTMNNTNSTVFGMVSVGRRGVFAYGIAASTNYTLFLSGITPTNGVKHAIVVGTGGTFTMGTAGSPIPSTSTATLTINTTSTGGFGVDCYGGTIEMCGQAKKAWTTLTATANSGQAVLTVVSTTGWAVGDVLAIAGTSLSSDQTEEKIILTVDSSTQVTLTTNLSNTHLAANTARGDAVNTPVGNVTRNVKIQGGSATNSTFIRVYFGSLTMRYIQCRFIGTNFGGIATAIYTNGLPGPTVSIKDCAIHEVTNQTIFICILLGSTYITTPSILIDNNLIYNSTSGGTSNFHIYLETTPAIITVTNNCMIKGHWLGINMNDVGGVITGNLVSNCQGPCYQMSEANAQINSFDSNIGMYSRSNGGLLINNNLFGTISNCSFGRGLDMGLYLNGYGNGLIINNCKIFGNTNKNLYVRTSTHGNIEFNNCAIYGESTFTSTNGLLTDLAGEYLRFNNCVFATHTNDINISTLMPGVTIILNNCLLSSATEVTGTLSNNSFVASSYHDQVSTAHKTWKTAGIISSDTTIFLVTTPSMRLTPSSATFKLESSGNKGGWLVPVTVGTVVTFSVNVRKSVVGDGTAYNGSQPRLIVKSNYGAGILTHTVLATGVSANGTWEKLTGTTVPATAYGILEFIVDCDGTAGWINIDDVSRI